MSILINEAYANPIQPLWASVGSGGGGGCVCPVFIDGTIGTIGVTFTEETGATIDVATLTMPSSTTSGKYVVHATYNFYGVGFSNQVDCRITEQSTGDYTATIMQTNETLSWVSGATSRVVNYTFGDPPPTILFQGIVSGFGGSPSLYLTYTIVFYPDA